MKSKKSERASIQKDRQDKLLEDRLLISDTHESLDLGLVADENMETENNEMSRTRELGAKPKQLLFDHIFPFLGGTKKKQRISILALVWMEYFIFCFWFFGIKSHGRSIKSI